VIGALLFVGFLLALALTLWAIAARALRLRAVMRRWPTETARVRDYRTRKGVRSVAVDVQVAFTHRGRSYVVWCTSPTRSAYGRGAGNPEEMERARFPRGSEQRVFVNPDHPETAYLELPEAHMIVLLLGGGALFAALAATLVLSATDALPQDLISLGFMLVLGVVLSAFAVAMGIALWRAPSLRRRRRRRA